MPNKYLMVYGIIIISSSSSSSSNAIWGGVCGETQLVWGTDLA